MKLLVTGQSVVDEIDSNEGYFIKPGGIFYAAVGLTQIKKETDEIFLITNLSDTDKKYFEDVYKKINLLYSTNVKKLPRVKLKIFENQERCETYSDVEQILTIPDNINFNYFNGILVNMISGFDITVNELKRIRENFNGLIYFDIHTLSRGVDENKKRKFRKIPQIEKWLNNIDIVQCNENELLTISGSEDETEIAKFVLSLRPEILIVTKGEKGVTLYKNKNGKIYTIHKEPIKVIPKNKVGCGDVFGATFFYTYIETQNEETALQTANIYAGLITKYTNNKDFNNLNSDYKNYND